MALDGFTVAAIVRELKHTIENGRISKIAQPENDELLLTVKGSEGQYRLLLSASASLPLAYLTSQNKPSPRTAPNFCMLLRKHIGGGRIVSVTQPGLERIISFEIEHLNDMGDLCRKFLIIELMGKHSNIIFCDDENKILDSINEYRRSKGHSELTLKDEYVECAKLQLQQAYFGSYDLGTTTASGKSATYLGPVCHSACDGSQFFEHYVLTPGNDGICNASLFEKEGIEVGIAYFNGIEYENYYGVSPVFTNEYQQLRNTIHVGLFIYE